MLLVNRYRYDMIDLSTLTVLGSTSKEHELHTKKSKMIKGSSFLFSDIANLDKTREHRQ